jgi:hypothetical protein
LIAAWSKARPRPGFDGTTIWPADDRQVERFRHARDLHPVRDAARAQQVDHHHVDRAMLEQVAER